MGRAREGRKGAGRKLKERGRGDADGTGRYCNHGFVSVGSFIVHFYD